MQLTDFSLIRLYSQRLAYLTQQVCEAQELAGLDGTDEKPWDVEFQRLAALEYERQLPRSYLVKRCRSFRACQQQMELCHHVPSDLTRHWEIVLSYLSNLAAALEERLDILPESDRGQVAGETPTTPGVVHFDKLAPLASRSAMKIQLAAARQVADFCLRQRFGGVTEEEISWITSLSRNRPVVEIAIGSGYSVRSMHRRLQELWSKMGVDGKTDAIVVAAAVGWLDRPEIPQPLLAGYEQAN